jgi:nitrate/nitrite-specific signal transduction histidine kinase
MLSGTPEASEIEAIVNYGTCDFRVSERDDRCGIDPAVLAEGRPGHWGLPVMRERAERIGARLELFSRRSAGTELMLTVPARIAYTGKEPKLAIRSLTSDN